jgi:hypothetical protein
VRDWLGEQTEAFRAAVEMVIIDPSAPYASGIRAALPHAKLTVDKWHLIALAKTMVTEVRQRTTRNQFGRRGRTGDAAWVNRKLLLTGIEHLSAKQWRRFTTMLDEHDPTGEIGAAWAVKERLRMLLAEHEPSRIRGGWPTSTTPRSTPSCPKRPGSPARSNLVAGHPRGLDRAGLERSDRGLQPDHQTGQTSRLRLPQHDQLPTPYPDPHRGHPTAKISSMNRSHPAQVRRFSGHSTNLLAAPSL